MLTTCNVEASTKVQVKSKFDVRYYPLAPLTPTIPNFKSGDIAVDGSWSVTTGAQANFECFVTPKAIVGVYDSLALEIGPRISPFWAKVDHKSECPNTKLPNSYMPQSKTALEVSGVIMGEGSLSVTPPGASKPKAEIGPFHFASQSIKYFEKTFEHSRGLGYCQAMCADGKLNGTETDVDCGGSCSTQCADLQKCKVNLDCESGACVSGICGPPCQNKVRDGQETDVDCGGDTCDKCENGKQCLTGNDCQSGFCREEMRLVQGWGWTMQIPHRTCVQDPCTDGVRSEGECGVDCGGTCDQKCGLGVMCGEDASCASGWSNGVVCVESHCQDGRVSGDETDVDCGGPTCAYRCGQGQQCQQHSDCQSDLVCSNGFCNRLSEPAFIHASQGEDTEHIMVHWAPVEFATRYEVYRNGMLIDYVYNNQYVDHDWSVRAPIVEPPQGVYASSDNPGGIEVAWDQVVPQSGASQSYFVRAYVDGTNASSTSQTVHGHTAARALQGYELEVVGRELLGFETHTTNWFDEFAPAHSFSTGGYSGDLNPETGVFTVQVDEPHVNHAQQQGYRVRPYVDGMQDWSQVFYGARGMGSFSYQWETSSDGWNFSPVSGQTQRTFTDTQLTRGVERWYRVVVSLPGVESQIVHAGSARLDVRCQDNVPGVSPPATQAALCDQEHRVCEFSSGMDAYCGGCQDGYFEDYQGECHLPLPSPEGLTASQGTSRTNVALSWSAVAGATGYNVYREGVLITAQPISALTYEDFDAPAGNPRPPTITTVTASSDNTDHVSLSWLPVSERVGDEASYQVQAVVVNSRESTLSESVSGYRAGRPVTGYQVMIDDHDITGIMTGTSWNDIDAPEGSIALGALSYEVVDATDRDVRLRLPSATPSNGAARSYKVRGVHDSNGAILSEGNWSEGVLGNRVVGELSYSWEEWSSGDSSYAAIAGASGTFDGGVALDYLADQREPLVEYTYRVIVNAPGAIEAISAPLTFELDACFVDVHCQPGGLCTDDYACLCSPGFEGVHCGACLDMHGTYPNCTPGICGNGILEEGEECDDGNTDDKDGCSASCVIESSYRCDTTVNLSTGIDDTLAINVGLDKLGWTWTSVEPTWLWDSSVTEGDSFEAVVSENCEPGKWVEPPVGTQWVTRNGCATPTFGNTTTYYTAVFYLPENISSVDLKLSGAIWAETAVDDVLVNGVSTGESNMGGDGYGGEGIELGNWSNGLYQPGRNTITIVTFKESSATHSGLLVAIDDATPPASVCDSAATVTTLETTDIGLTTATLHADLYADELPEMSAHGFCYGTMASPSHLNGATCTDLGALAVEGPFTEAISGLERGVNYNVRAYVTIPAGNLYGDSTSFWTYADVVQNVQASSQINAVALSWDEADGAAEYRVYRQGPEDLEPVYLGKTDAPSLTYTDTTAEGGSPNQVVVTTPETKHTDFVRLDWTDLGVSDGDTYEYIVVATNGGGIESDASTSASAAAQGAAIIDYEVEIDNSGTWNSVGNVLYLEDTTAPAGSIVPGEIAVANGINLDVIALSSAAIVSSEDGATRSYRVRAVHEKANTDAQQGDASDEVSSNRVVDPEEVQYLWHRDEDGHDEAPVSVLCAELLSCDDNTAVMGTNYTYRLLVTVAGAEPAFSSAQTGALAVPSLEFATQPDATITAGEAFSTAVRLLNQFDAPLLASNVSVTLTLNKNLFGEESPEASVATTTDEDGVAVFDELVVTVADIGYFVTATSVDSRLDGVSTPSETFVVQSAAVDAEQSTISGESGKYADGVEEAEIYITLEDRFGNPIVGVQPTFSATGADNTYVGCSSTSSLGESLCGLKTLSSGTKTLKIESPVESEGGTIHFKYICAGSAFQDGDGSEGWPYDVCNVEQLNAIGADSTLWDKHFVLVDNLDMSELGATPYNIIGNTTTVFSGSFDGQGFTIDNLTINAPATQHVGMFGRVSGADARVRNLSLVNVNVVGDSTVGALAGDVTHSGAQISRVSVTGSVSANGGNIGGVIGGNAGIVSEVSADVVVTKLSSETGGNIGGLIGVTTELSYLSDSYSMGSVHSVGAAGHAGGVVGRQVTGTLERIYTTASVSSDTYGGRVRGWQDGAPVVIDVYYSLDVSCTVENGSCAIHGTALSFEQMSDQVSYADHFDGFVFGSVWEMVGCGTPRLVWENEEECSGACSTDSQCLNGGVCLSDQACECPRGFGGENCTSCWEGYGTYPECTPGICGNGILEPGEECDDGNTAEGDGCSSTCIIENHFSCENIIPVSTGSFGHDAATISTRDILWTWSEEAPEWLWDASVEVGTYFQAVVSENCAPGSWVNAPTGTQWITRYGCATPTPGDSDTYYSATFDLHEDLKRVDVLLSGTIWTDNWVKDILVNGMSTGINNIGQTGFANPGLFFGNFDKALYQPGRNTITIVTYNDGVDPNPAGFLVAIADASLLSSYCKAAICGNGILEPGEECDDGNNDDGDGCSSTCTVEEGFRCDNLVNISTGGNGHETYDIGSNDLRWQWSDVQPDWIWDDGVATGESYAAVVSENCVPGPGSWADAPAGTQWVTRHGCATLTPGSSDTYYTAFFDMPAELNRASVQLNGSIVADNWVKDILVNGVSTGINNIGAVGYWSPGLSFGDIDSSLYQAGRNAITVVAYNDGGEANAAGMFVSMADTTLPASICVVACTPSNPDFTQGPGDGSSADPYEICSAAQMNFIGTDSAHWNKHFILVDNIDMADLEATPYNIIGHSITAFSGTFDGQYHTIENLTISDSVTAEVGLFGRATGTIKNLRLHNVDVTSTNDSEVQIGALVGQLSDAAASVSRVSVSGAVSANRGNIGGLIGGSIGAISETHSSATVTKYSHVEGANIGGLIGVISGGSTVYDSYSTGSVHSTDAAGHAGGLLGRQVGATLTRVYSTATVHSYLYGGRIRGWQDGIVPVNDSYHSTEVSCTVDDNTYGCQNNGTNLTMAEMTDQVNYATNFDGFDFIGVWEMTGCGTPRLAWQSLSCF